MTLSNASARNGLPLMDTFPLSHARTGLPPSASRMKVPSEPSIEQSAGPSQDSTRVSESKTMRATMPPAWSRKVPEGVDPLALAKHR